LLPNRLYEGCAQGVVPLALDGTEVAARLRTLGIGVIAQGAREDALRTALVGVDRAAMAGLRDRLAVVPRATWEAGPEDSLALVALLEDRASGVVPDGWMLA
jgi:succinoglycan biosynthesis protein ExoL